MPQLSSLVILIKFAPYEIVGVYELQARNQKIVQLQLLYSHLR